jgi:hypothetical protein
MDPSNNYLQKAYIECFNVQIFEKSAYTSELNCKLGTKTLTFKKEDSLVQSVFLSTFCYLNCRNAKSAENVYHFLRQISSECRTPEMKQQDERIIILTISLPLTVLKKLLIEISDNLSSSQPEFIEILPELIGWAESIPHQK